MIVRVERHPTGRRCFIFGHRVHHGLCGLLAIAAGLAAVIDDFHDAPWLKDTP